MTAVIGKIASHFQGWIPQGFDRQIALSVGLIDLVGSNLPRGREEATLYQLKDRINVGEATPFSQWIQQEYPVNNIKQLRTTPEQLLLQAHMFDLTQKVIAATACYLTIQVSLYTSIVHILSQSAQVAKVALPIFNQMAALPIPPVLYSASVIVLTPVVVKMFHMAFIYLNLTKGREFPFLAELEKCFGKLSQAIEMLWHVRFALICLRKSSTLPGSILSTALDLAINYISEHYSIDLTLLKIILTNFIIISDLWASWGFSAGLKGTIHSFFNPTEPYDAETLEELFNQVNRIEGDLQQLQDNIEAASTAITEALRDRLISNFQAEKLKQMLYKKHQDSLKQLLQNNQLSSIINTVTFKSIYGPQAVMSQMMKEDSFNWNAFVDLLNRSSSFTLRLENLGDSASRLKEVILLLETSLEKRKITQRQDLFFQEVLCEQIEEFYNSNIEHHLDNSNFWLDAEKEKNLRAIYGRNGYLEQLRPSWETFVLQNHFLFALFKHQLNWYLEHQSELDENQQRACEWIIYYQAVKRDDIFNLKWDDMLKNLAFVEHLKQRYLSPLFISEENQAAEISSFVVQSTSFSYLQEDFILDDSFRFKTVTLPIAINELRHRTIKQFFINAKHFPVSTIEGLEPHAIPDPQPHPSVKNALEQEQELYINRITTFFSHLNKDNTSNILYSDLIRIQNTNFS